jgi:hypothetical protein
LLSDLRELFEKQPSGVLFTHEILDELRVREDRPYSECHRGKEMSAPQMAAMLRSFRIPTNQTVRRGPKTGKGYKAEWFTDAWTRYLPEP